MTRKFTGWHMAALLIAFFAVVVTVNFAMAWFAVSGFGGVVVENSYVASQRFNRWLGEQRREDRLGWKASMSRDGMGRIVVVTEGVPAGARIVAHLRRPIGLPDDRTVTLIETGLARFTSPGVEPGRWIVRVEVNAESRRWSAEGRIG